MNKFRHLLFDAGSVKHYAEKLARSSRIAVPMAIVGLMLGVTARAQDPAPLEAIGFTRT